MAQSESTGATLVASLHAVDLALRWFPRIVGMRDGQVAFDLPAAQVTPALLEALYASEGGVATQGPLPVAPVAGTAEPAFHRPDCP
ncbi:phosphonate/organophosphate ester transporter subunit [compost metagenome]